MDEQASVATHFLSIDRDTVKLLRIPFSYFLMPVFFFALSQASEINWPHAVICFVVLHLFTYPASNGYNSYMDQDETSIGGLEHPPKPTKKLFYTSLLLDIVALALALAVNLYFFIGVLVYTLASRAYSYKGIRLKKYAIPGFLTVVIFQGAITYWMIYSGVSKSPLLLNTQSLIVLTACSFLIGGVYPLTQVYQHEADRANGDISISCKLGVKGTFIFSAIMFGFSNCCFYLYFNSLHLLNYFIIFQAFLLPVIIYFVSWFLKVIRDKEQASFKNTMRMNLIASTCMNLCFITMLILNLLK